MSSPVAQTGTGVATPQAVLQNFQVSDADVVQVRISTNLIICQFSVT